MSMNVVTTLRRPNEAVTITAGTTSDPYWIYSPYATISLVPGSGGTMTLYVTCSSREAIAAGTANWLAISSMTGISSHTLYTLEGPATAVKVSAVTANGVMEVVQ